MLLCTVEGDPAPSFKWLRGMREVLPGGRFKHLTMTEDNSVSLIISKCRPQDDGV